MTRPAEFPSHCDSRRAGPAPKADCLPGKTFGLWAASAAALISIAAWAQNPVAGAPNGATAPAPAITPPPAPAQPAHGAQAPKAGTPAKPDPAKAQQIATTVCAACHGPDGNSPSPANPSLAGQHPAYIVKQLANFKAGVRKNPIMQAMAAPLSPDDMRNLGVYFAEQKPKPGFAKDKDLAALGEKLYRGGNLATGLPACAGCHGPAGYGIPIQYPHLAGQYSDYLMAQLKAFRSGERANDSGKMMRTIAAKMSDSEMQAVSEYIAGLRRTDADLAASR